MNFTAINYGDSVLLVSARHISSPIFKIASLADYKKCVYYNTISIINTVYIFLIGLIVSFDGQRITGNGDDHVSVTNITTNNTESGLSCTFTQRITGGELRWYLNEVKLPNRAGEIWQSYFGWSSLPTVYKGFPVSTLKRDAATDAIEGIFTCQQVIGRDRYSSVPIGVYYPSKVKVFMCLL